MAIANNEGIKRKILNEGHTVPSSVHPSVQCTLNKLRQKFFWKRQTNDVRDFVSSCIIFQTENSDHTLSKGQLQNPELPVPKWQEISVDFVTDLHVVNSFDSIMAVIDKSTRMTHIIPCSKIVTAQQTAQYYLENVTRFHGVPKFIYTDRGTQFTSKFWKELWGLLGTGFRFSTAFHPHRQGIVGRMNAVIGQMLRSTLASMNERKN